MPHPHCLLVTGKLAEPALRRQVAALSPRLEMELSVAVLPITVVALATTSWVARHLRVPAGVDRVVLPGLCLGDLQECKAAAGVPVERGPNDLRDLPDFFGTKSGPPSDYGGHDIEILAEINHAARLSRDELLHQAQAYRASGADVIDLGCDPGDAWSGVGAAVQALRDQGMRVSIDSFNAEEVEAAVRAGAELVLSINSTNLNVARSLGCEVVAIPDTPSDLGSLERTVETLAGWNVPFRIDPVLEPIGFGFAASLGRFLEARRRFPDVEIMMGVGNLTELTDVDSAGVNVVLLGFCQELGIRSVLTTEVINWCRSSVRELDLARRLVHHAVTHKVLPKHSAPELVVLRDTKLRIHGEEVLRELAAKIADRNFRLFAERGLLHVLNGQMQLEGDDPFALFEEMQKRQAIDPAHAFYLGYELSKAATALTLGKNYVQDQALDWGFLTAPERARHAKIQGSHPDSKRKPTRHDAMTRLRPDEITLRLPRSVPRPPLVEELTPAPDPVAVVRRLAHLPGLLFLDSALRHPRLGRYSFITADPYDRLYCRGDYVWGNGRQYRGVDPFELLAELLDTFRSTTLPDLPPFQGGAAGVFGYDLCHHLERLPRPEFDDFQTPDLAVGFYDWVISFDHETNRAWLISTGAFEPNPRFQRRRAELRLRKVKRLLTEFAAPEGYVREPAARIETPHFPLDSVRRGLFSDFDRASYLAAARRAIEYIHAGDCYQVNLAQRLLYPARTAPLDLYLRLRDCNPAPFGGFCKLGEFSLASASPERFLKMVQREVETRPIKGTRRVAESEADDRQVVHDLRQSAKDRAENIMIVDLLRNDLGRVCEYGTVHVPELCALETYGTVHHLVSAVRGRLRKPLGSVDLMRATFPGGSVTGAPKIRAMEIIAELEPAARGPYCGCLGYLGFDGALDLNILIRTFTIGRGWLQFPVGGGIVADSDPEREYEETWDKAEGLLRAL